VINPQFIDHGRLLVLQVEAADVNGSGGKRNR